MSKKTGWHLIERRFEAVEQRACQRCVGLTPIYAHAPRVLPEMRVLVLLALGLVVGCQSSSEESEDAEDGNSAVTTPRQVDESSLAAQQETRTAELGRALQNAKPEDFGNAISPQADSFFDRVSRLYSRSDGDIDGRAYSFITGTNKAYIFETHPKRSGEPARNLYLYDAVGYPKTESKPLPLGKCSAASLDDKAPLTCKSVAKGAYLFE